MANLQKLPDLLITAFEEEKRTESEEQKITVNPVIAEVASWYEKLRNAMDYKEEEVVLRSAIERILKRRLLLNTKGEEVAEPLIRELVWARYFPDGSVPKAIIAEVASKIDLYKDLESKILASNKIPEKTVHEWIYQLLSSDLSQTLSPSSQKNILSYFMFQIVKNSLIISDDSEETRDAQVFIAVRRVFAKDDTAFLRYHLFKQFFGEISTESITSIALRFTEGYQEIEKQLNYPLRFTIFSHIKKQAPPFFILEELISRQEGNLRTLVQDDAAFETQVFEICNEKYKAIAAKVQRAILRSFVFILLTKVFFAFAIEGTYETLVYGGIQWLSLALNALIPPLLMVVMGVTIRAPGQENSVRILKKLRMILFDETPKLVTPLTISLAPEKKHSYMHSVFTLLWIVAFVSSFGLIIYILSLLNFTLMSQLVFLFFLTIVSFLCFRINTMAKEYTIYSKQGLLTPIIDFFIMPIVHVGRHFAEGVSQINILLYVLDVIIETPFKSLFGFFEQLFLYLHTKRDNLG